MCGWLVCFVCVTVSFAAIMPFPSLHTIELQLLQLARCSRATLAAASTPFAWWALCRRTAATAEETRCQLHHPLLDASACISARACPRPSVPCASAPANDTVDRQTTRCPHRRSELAKSMRTRQQGHTRRCTPSEDQLPSSVPTSAMTLCVDSTSVLRVMSGRRAAADADQVAAAGVIVGEGMISAGGRGLMRSQRWMQLRWELLRR